MEALVDLRAMEVSFDSFEVEYPVFEIRRAAEGNRAVVIYSLQLVVGADDKVLAVV